MIITNPSQCTRLARGIGLSCRNFVWQNCKLGNEKTERSPLRWSYETPTTTNLVCFIILLDLHFLFTTRRTKETSDTADKLSMEE